MTFEMLFSLSGEIPAEPKSAKSLDKHIDVVNSRDSQQYANPDFIDYTFNVGYKVFIK